MGCWEATCAITRMPIYESDPCVMVVFENNFVTTSMHTLWSPSDISKHVQLIAKGPYDDAGWLKDVKEPVENYTRQQLVIFFHQDVWDQCISLWRKNHTITDKEIEDSYYHDMMFEKMKSIRLKEQTLDCMLETVRKQYPISDLNIGLYAMIGFAVCVRQDILSPCSYQDHARSGERDLALKLAHEHNEKIKKRWEN